MLMSDKVYDFLSKFQRWLPALGAFYLGLCKVWDLPLGSEVNETIVLIATLLATTLEIATVNYHKAMNEESLSEDEMRPEDEINLDEVIHQAEEGQG